jgi:hypothetical protein
MRDFAKVRRLAARGGAPALAAAALAVLGVAPAGAAVFTSNSPITIPTQGGATPYPSTIDVSGQAGAVTNVTASLNGFTASFPADIDMLLVGPGGQNVVLMADAGAGNPVANINLTFSDAAGTILPTPIVAGTFRPTNLGTFSGGPPAPPPPRGTQMAAFNGTVANGQWRLFIFDDDVTSATALSSWSLDITTNGPSIASFTPTTGPAGTQVAITGTNLTGATGVTFGGTPAAAFTVTSPTTINATVPAGATSGPISVATPNGNASSTTNFLASPPPTITAVAPATGATGTAVTLTGTNFTGATDVRFAGTPATFTVASPTSITTSVPNGAGSGPVTVTTPGGTTTSTTPFVVTHARTVTLTIAKQAASGKLTASDNFTKCAAGVRVTLEKRKKGGTFVTKARDVTETDGTFSIPGKRKKGKVFRIKADATTLPAGDSCGEALSPDAKRGR